MTEEKQDNETRESEAGEFKDSWFRRAFGRKGRPWARVGPEHKASTGFGQWMQSYVGPYWTNNVSGLVYGGAAFLVIIVGLRGLGKLSESPYVPHFLLADDGRLYQLPVLVALGIECLMLIVLAILYMYTPEKYAEDTHIAGNKEKEACFFEAKELVEKVRPPKDGNEWVSLKYVGEIAEALRGIHKRKN